MAGFGVREDYWTQDGSQWNHKEDIRGLQRKCFRCSPHIFPHYGGNELTERGL